MKDERKGVDDSRMTESIDAFTSNKIVENEINVLKSYNLMNKVVTNLKLYAPIYDEGKYKTIPAYTSSPLQIELKNPESAQEYYNIYFTFSEVDNKVHIENKAYPLNEWVQTPYGEILFTRNKNKKESPQGALYFNIMQPRKATNSLLAQVFIETSSKLSTVITLGIQDPNPKRGEDILNTLIYAYNQLAIDERNDLAANTLKFVEDRIQLVEKELEDLESQVVKFKSRKGAVDLSEQGRLFLQNVGDNDRKIAEINTQLAVLNNVEKYVISKDKSAGIVPSTLGVNDPVLSQLLQKLYDSEIQYQKLRVTTAENNPLLITLADEIEKIRPSILENIRHQRVNLEASKANMASTNNMYNTALQTIPQKEKELLDISRQQLIKNEAYRFLLQKREETVLSYAPSAGDFRVVDMAEASIYPTSPNATYIYLIAALVACGAGIALVTGKEFLNNKLLFRSQIEEYTNAPIVAELANIKHQKKEKLFKAPTEISVVEQFRQLRSTMGLYGRTFTKKKIMVTSSIPGEGKSYVSTNLSFSLASSGKKIALLDFDLRNPRASELFDLLDQKGITEYLFGEAQPGEIIMNTDFENLYVIPAGVNIGDHSDVLANGKLEVLFEYLQERFDYIILDTPPLELVSDGYFLSEFCDINLLVMRHAYTPKQIVQRMAQDNKLKKLNQVAIVFNGVKPRGFVKGQYGYGYGYGYENKYSDKTYRARMKKTKA
ncbi:GumC family protein [Pontibacter ruber]|uniref:non-specific protein-tyrosine kinase n=1 Tax=Pontibacter ruber TaxID=1343895 RepID=A0ABW5D111_9BACT|nr:tyrosine-protein kinase family protein [Pontibacter ruber]